MSATKFNAKYSPGLLKRIYILLLDNLVGLLRVLRGFPRFFLDYIRSRLFGSPLPSTIMGLLDLECFNHVSDRKAVSVSLAEQKEQHANSTDRAWFRVRFEGDSDDTFVFAKCQARNFFVCTIMSIFNVYSNELAAYASLDMGIKLPQVIGAKQSPSRFVLILEDLAKRQVEFPNIWSKRVDVDLGKKVLTTLATIHAKFWEKSPAQVWNEENRPYYGLGMGMFTLFNVERTCKPGLIPKDVHDVYMQALWHWVEYRAYQSRSQPKTMCHGDSHMGNFYIERNGEIGTVDFQVLSEENPMRDVAYFLSSSFDPDLLQVHEGEMIQFYLDELKRLGVKHNLPSFDQAWYAYRMQLFAVLYAFVFSGGFANLMDTVQTNCGVERIVRVMQRVDSTGALYQMLDGKELA